MNQYYSYTNLSEIFNNLEKIGKGGFSFVSKTSSKISLKKNVTTTNIFELNIFKEIDFSKKTNPLSELDHIPNLEFYGGNKLNTSKNGGGGTCGRRRTNPKQNTLEQPNPKQNTLEQPELRQFPLEQPVLRQNNTSVRNEITETNQELNVSKLNVLPSERKSIRLLLFEDIVKGEVFALKCMTYKDEPDLMNLLREPNFLINLNHPNIIELKGLVLDTKEQNLYLIMENVENISLIHHFNTKRVNDSIPPDLYSYLKYMHEKLNQLKTHISLFKHHMFENYKYILLQLLYVLNYIHNKKIVYLDIKPQNILLKQVDDEHGNFKYYKVILIDFGISRYLNNPKPPKASYGTPAYASPNIIKHNIGNPNAPLNMYNPNAPLNMDNPNATLDFSTDVWSLGMLVYQLLTGHLLLEKYQIGIPIFIMSLNNQKTIDDEIKANKIFESLPEEAKDLIKQMLKINPEERITIQDILFHPFLHGIRIDISNVIQQGGGKKKSSSIKTYKFISGRKRIIYTGSRGGKYYISKGRKIYI